MANSSAGAHHKAREWKGLAMNQINHAEMTIATDQDAVNLKLLAKQKIANFKRVESSSRKVPVMLSSPEGKRLYLRCFDITQANFHFIAVFARLKLPAADIDKIEQELAAMLNHRLRRLDQALVDTEAACRSKGIDTLASYDVASMLIEARIFSKFGSQLLEMIEKVDQLMPMLETLCIDGALSNAELGIEKARLKKVVRSAASASRVARAMLEQRMNAAAALAPEKKKRADVSDINAPHS